MLFILLALHAVAGGAVLTGASRVGRRGFVLGGLAPAATALWAAAAAPGILDGRPVDGSVDWVPALGLTLDVRVDAFALLMLVLVAGIGSLVFVYGWHYFAGSADAGRAAGLLTLFAGSMVGVVVADNLLFLFVCWELTSITSYLLIGLHSAREEARSAALQALLVTGGGGLAMLGGFVLLGQAADTYRIGELLASPPGGTTTSVALVLVLVGAFTKSAQYPFHSWLPGAMVAPTPISAYLHSAAMVKAGIYLVARLAPVFADVGVWRPLVVVVGLVTMVAGGLRALRPFDLKQVLAFGTISQLGFMMVLLGIGRPEATVAGCAVLLAHGLFKAALFMVVGIVDHETGTRDIRELPLLRDGWGVVRVVAVVSAASMAGLPPLAGFIAKEEAYGAFVHGTAGDRLVLAGIVAGSVLTMAYSLRLGAALVRPDLVSPAPTPAHAPAGRPAASHAPSRGFVLPATVLATATVALGVAPVLWSSLVDQAAHALDGDAHAHLALWHGVNTALVLSVATWLAGAAVFRGRRPVEAWLDRAAPSVSAAAVYERSVRGLQAFAGQVTSVVQSGSLPVYATIIFLTAASAPVAALVTGTWWPGWPDLVGRAAHLPVAALMVVGATAATLATRRFAAAILLGVVGYGMALLFVVQGDPDLALTQFAVETLSVVVFLLVLRRLPDRFERRRPAVGRSTRLAVSAAVGCMVVLLGIAASGSRTAAPVSDEMSRQALSEGDGRNVVNVILVDVRGLDTLGEITVLAVAGIGITALARARGRAGSPGRRPGSPPSRPAPGEAAGTGVAALGATGAASGGATSGGVRP